MQQNHKSKYHYLVETRLYAKLGGLLSEFKLIDHRTNLFNISFMEVIEKILNTNAAPHLWFISLILEIYIFYLILIRIYQEAENKNKEKHLIVISFIVQVIAWGLLPYTNFLLFRYIFFFYIGVNFSRNYKFVTSKLININIKKLFFLTLVSCAIYTAPILYGFYAYGYRDRMPKLFTTYVWMFQTIYDFIAFLTCYRLSILLKENYNLFSKILEKIGGYSFGVYLIHFLVMRLFIKILFSIGLNIGSWVLYPLLFILTVAISYLIIIMLNYLPANRWIIGSKR